MSRIAYIDIARGGAILLVVLGHAIQYVDPAFDDNLVYRLIYAVHMPLFMTLSGMVARLPERFEASRLDAKVRQLLVPFLAWIPLSYLAIRYLQRPAGGTPDFADFLAQVARNPDAGGLWFLLVLFECHVLLQLFGLAGRLRLGAAATLTLALLLAMNVLVIACPAANWLGLGLLRWYFLFFMAGVLAGQAGCAPPGAPTSIALAVAYLALAVFWTRKGAVPIDTWAPSLHGAARQLAVQGYHAFAAFVGIAAALGLASKPSQDLRTSRVLADLGARSLQIYAGHYVFLYLGIAMTATLLAALSLHIAVVAAIALAGALALARVVRHSGIASRLLYGR